MGAKLRVLLGLMVVAGFAGLVCKFICFRERLREIRIR